MQCPLLVALAEFCALVLRGDVPQEVRPFFFGASLVALKKKCGGVRPISVGCTLRRLVTKITSKRVVDDMAELLAPIQLGYGVRGGSEAAVHAARCFLSNMEDHVFCFLSNMEDHVFCQRIQFHPHGLHAGGCREVLPFPVLLGPFCVCVSCWCRVSTQQIQREVDRDH